MPATPLITVSFVTYHTSLPILLAAIASLRQSGVPLDIAVADNSLDAAYFAQLQAESGVLCIPSPFNGGYGYGHNLAFASLPDAPYHLVMNPDVIVQPGCLETLVSRLRADASVGLCVPQIHYLDGRPQRLNKRDPNVLDMALRRFAPAWLRRLPPVRRRMERYIMADQGYDAAYDVPYASGCFMLFRREIFSAVGGFDERFFMYMEDADITRRARALARVVYCPEARIAHRWTRGAYHKPSLMWATFVSAYSYFRKWGWAWR